MFENIHEKNHIQQNLLENGQIHHLQEKYISTIGRWSMLPKKQLLTTTIQTHDHQPNNSECNLLS